jgi:hypothetical protein
MTAQSPQNAPNPRWIRTLGTLYGIVMINIGAFLLYDALTAPEVVFNTNFRIGSVCLLLGITALFFARRSRRKGP